MKKTIKHAIAFALLVCFAVLALGSMGSSPSSGSSGSGGAIYTFIFENRSSAVIKVNAGGETFTLNPGGSRTITSSQASINVNFDAEGPKQVRAEHLNRYTIFYDN